MKVTQLQLLSSYSLLKSTNRLPQLIEKAKDKGYTAIGITDINVMSGVIEFYRISKKYDIKPIIGLTIDYQVPEIEQRTFSLVLHAKNNEGYKNLLKISTLKMSASTPFFTKEDLFPLLHNLFVTLPVENSEVSFYLASEKEQVLSKILEDLLKHVDEESLYGGISIHQKTEERDQLINLYRSNKIPLISAESVRYLNPSDHFSLEVLHHIDKGTRIESLENQQTGSHYLADSQVLVESYEKLGMVEALENANHVADVCHVEINFTQTLLPHYKTPEDKTAESYLRELCFTYLPQRVPNYDERYVARLEKELNVIHTMGFDDYFLIVWDVMAFAEKQKIVTGAGRGSAAGALVSYCLSITDVDPIEYNLLFERFLNIERNSMPDIDLDIPDNRRDEVLHYVHEKYGEQHMAQIATFGTMAAKMVLRDVCRVFGLSQSEANQWSSAIPSVLKITLEQAFQQSKKLQHLVNSSERNKLIFELALKLEGLPRHVSTHAAGVVISDHVLTDVVPLQAGAGDIPLTQFAMGDVEAVGLLKMDFLGLRNLSIIDDTLKHVKRLEGIDLDLKKIPKDDEKTLELFRKGNTIGVFQFESTGIRNVLRKVSPESIEDIAAVNALFRPGPMDNIDLFVKRKKGLTQVTYPDDSLKDILDVTYGIIVYQEQIMQVAAKMAGFTLGQADILQRAISKKVKGVMVEQKQNFINGSIKQGFTKETAEEVYAYIEKFANYGFNRSHAMAYSFVGYQMAYLKVHYPVPFFAALLHSVRHNMGKVKEYLGDARKYGLVTKGPNINRSYDSFSLMNNHELLFGFGSLKGMRKDFIKDIVAERKKHGGYSSLDNFLIRMDNRWLKEELILPLIQIGAFDEVEPNRRQLVKDLKDNIENILFSSGSADLLNFLELKDTKVTDYSVEERLSFEEELLGAYVSGHPVEQYDTIKMMKGVRPINQGEIGKKQTSLVYLKKIKEIRTKKGEKMAFLDASDESSDIAITIFPIQYRRIERDLHENGIYLVTGKLEQSKYNQELQLIGENIQPISEIEKEIGKKICYLKIPINVDEKSTFEEIKKIIGENKGINPVIVYVEKSHKKHVLQPDYWLAETALVKDEMVALLGETNCVFK